MHRRRQLVFHVVEDAEEVDDRVDAIGDSGMRTVLDEELKILAGTPRSRSMASGVGFRERE